MTTTGDLFVNIKGNNRGLKQSLNQSSRDIGRFGQKTQQQMKGGLGFGELLGIGAISNLGKIGNAIKTLNTANTHRKLGTFADSMNVIRGQKQMEDQIMNKRRHFAHDGNIAGYRQATNVAARSRASRRRTVNTMKDVRDKVSGAQDYINPAKALMVPGAVAAIAAVAGAVLVANGKKWADRINESAMQFSGAAIGNQARLDAANMRRDIQLAKSGSGSAIFRQNAADFRKNSGAGGQVTNFLGGAYDAAVGAGSNAIFGIPGLIMNIKQISDTVGGPK